MSDLGVGRGRAAVARLSDVAGPELYARNPFRLTGLPTDATRRTVRRRQQRATAVLDIGGRPESDSVLPPPNSPSRQELAAAFEEIGDSERRIVAELFWWWDTSDASCGCPAGLHTDHDAAVRAHAEVLDAHACGTDWRRAGELWTALVDREDFWDHLRRRIAALDDRRLDESIVDPMRYALPGALVAPLVSLAEAADDPQDYTYYFQFWGPDRPAVRDRVERAGATVIERIQAVRAEARGLMVQERTADAGALLMKSLPPLANRLEALTPHREFRPSAAEREQVAVALHNCAVAWRGEDPETARPRAMLDRAAEYAVEEETARAIRHNRFYDEVTRVLAPLYAEGGVAQMRARLRDWRQQAQGDQELLQQIDDLDRGRTRPIVPNRAAWQSAPRVPAQLMSSADKWRAARLGLGTILPFPAFLATTLPMTSTDAGFGETFGSGLLVALVTALVVNLLLRLFERMSR